MKQALAMMAVVVALLEIGRQAFGEAQILLVVYGAMAVMSAMIAATFLWLWFERTTPLAHGMVYSWSGAALFIGWWWVYNLAGQPEWGHLPRAGFVVQALSFVGAVLHFAVIHRSFGYHGVGFIWPVGLALAISGLVALLV
mgnify:CR=1 FL=1